MSPEDDLKQYKQYMRELERVFRDLENDTRAIEAAAAREQERLRLEQVDRQIDKLWPETVQLGRLAGMSGLGAVAWAFNMARGAKQLARQPWARQP
jgi:hypothetical protein